MNPNVTGAIVVAICFVSFVLSIRHFRRVVSGRAELERQVQAHKNQIIGGLHDEWVTQAAIAELRRDGRI